jgi:hypothetical protein
MTADSATFGRGGGQLAAGNSRRLANLTPFRTKNRLRKNNMLYESLG